MQSGRPVAGLLGVVGQPGVVAAAGVAQRGHNAGVNGRPAVPGDRLFHRAAGDLMPEPQLRPGRGQQAGFSQPVHHLWRAGGGPLKQRRLDRGTDQCRDIEHVARLRPESRGPGQHRVAGRGRYPVQPGLQHLRDVERVSAGGLVQLGGIQAAVPGHDRHGPRRQREQFDPPGTPLHRELPESHPQRVAHRQLILPVCSHDQDRDAVSWPQVPALISSRCGRHHRRPPGRFGGDGDN